MTARQTYLFKVAVAFTLSMVITILLMLPASASALNMDTVKDDPYRVETFSITTPGNLEVRTSGGHITVEGSSSNTVRVEMYVRKNGRDLSPDDIDLDKWEITIDRSGNSVRALAKRDGKGWKLWNNDNVSISFVVYTPREMSTDLKTSGGHIEASGLEGKQNISTSGGHLELANLKGTIDARTSGGHINIDAIQGEIVARTSGGHIDAKQSEGALKVRTSGGHIELDDVSGTVEASTSGGSITANLGSIGQFVDLRTSGGNVRITVPENIGLDINLRGSYVSTNLKNFSGNIERNEVEGKLNGGGPKISARTSGGTVSLSFR